jgi:hypothetical protein
LWFGRKTLWPAGNRLLVRRKSTGNAGNCAGLHLRRIGPHGFTNRPGSLSRVWRVAGYELAGNRLPLLHRRQSMEDRTSPRLQVLRFHLRLPLNLPESLSQHLLCFSPLSISRCLISLSLHSLCLWVFVHGREKKNKKKKRRRKKEEIMKEEVCVVFTILMI